MELSTFLAFFIFVELSISLSLWCTCTRALLLGIELGFDMEKISSCDLSLCIPLLIRVSYTHGHDVLVLIMKHSS